MSREQSDREDSVVGTGDGPFDDGTAETEVNGRLTCGSALGLELVVPTVPGVITPDPGQQRRLGPLSGAKLHQSSLKTPTMLTPGLGSLPPRAGIQPAIVRFVETPTMPTPGHGSPSPKGRNATGKLPVRGNADHANPGAWQPAAEGRSATGNRPVCKNADQANPGTWQSTTEGRNTAGE